MVKENMEGFELMGQGAEARLYRGMYLGRGTLVKERFEKKYRHPDLDARLTRDRIRAEARAIVRAKAAGVPTPALYLVDLRRRSIYMEYAENARTLKNFIQEQSGACEKPDESNFWIDQIFKKLAHLVAKLHSKNIIHGDLTTSNVLLTSWEFAKEGKEPSLLLVDFGLARVESTSEDKAVDLYVLQRSLLSLHAEWPTLFPTLLAHYTREIHDEKQRREIISNRRARVSLEALVGRDDPNFVPIKPSQ